MFCIRCSRYQIKCLIIYCIHVAGIKSNTLSISADNSIQDPIINLMNNIQPCIVSDVAGIKSNTVNNSAYNSIQDPKYKYKSDSKSNLINNNKLKFIKSIESKENLI